jgi:cyclase
MNKQEARVPEQLADGIYYHRGYSGGNIGLVVTARGAVLIDTPMLPPDARHWQQVITQLGADEIYGIVNTDYHPEHMLGNATFMPARIFGHMLSAKPLARFRNSGLEPLSNQYRDTNLALSDEIMQIDIPDPEIMVADCVTLCLDSREIQILYLEGHTPASLGVYLPTERILFAGDNITHNEHPIMSQCSSQAWIETLARIDAMDVDVIIPASGDPCDKQVIRPLHDYISEMRKRIEELYEKGASRRECVDKIDMLDWFPVPDDQLTRMKRRVRENIEQVYTEFRTVARRQRQRSRRPRRSS